ncbi:MAG: biotin/lipoyl-containing protein [Candidatus Sericytochromatia bacterium]
MPRFRYGQNAHEIKALGQGRYRIDEQDLEVALRRLDPATWLLSHNGKQRLVSVLRLGDQIQIRDGAETYSLQPQLRSGSVEEPAADRILAPLTGKVIQVKVAPGERVSKGQTLVVLESMKMETALSAPLDATVSAVHCSAGEQVGNGQLLVALELDQEISA